MGGETLLDVIPGVAISVFHGDMVLAMLRLT